MNNIKRYDVIDIMCGFVLFSTNSIEEATNYLNEKEDEYGEIGFYEIVDTYAKRKLK